MMAEPHYAAIIQAADIMAAIVKNQCRFGDRDIARLKELTSSADIMFSYPNGTFEPCGEYNRAAIRAVLAIMCDWVGHPLPDPVDEIGRQATDDEIAMLRAKEALLANAMLSVGSSEPVKVLRRAYYLAYYLKGTFYG